MPAEYNPFADLEAYGADVARRKAGAMASSAQADQAALKLGMQNLEGNQAMSKQQLINRGQLDNTGLENVGKQNVAYIGQKVDPHQAAALRASQLRSALEAENYKNIGAGTESFRKGGRAVDDDLDLKASDFPAQELMGVEPTDISAGKAMNTSTANTKATVARTGAVDNTGQHRGVAQMETRTGETGASQTQRGRNVETPLIPHSPNGSKRERAQQRQQQQQPQAEAPAPATNPAQTSLDYLKSKGKATPDTELTGNVDARGRPEVKDKAGNIGWLNH
jgi:hypothetical protein